MQYGGNDACRAVGRCGNDASAGGVFFVDRHGVHHRPELGVDDFGFAQDFELGGKLRGAAADVQSAGQFAVRTQAAFDAAFHNLGNGSGAAADFGFAASGKRGFVCQHDFGDVEPVQTASGKQFGATGIGIGNGFFRFRLPVKIFFGNDKAAADRIINLFFQDDAV